MSKLELKYFRKIDAAAAADDLADPQPLLPFDITPFVTQSRVQQRIGRFVFRSIMPAFFFMLRAFWPVARIGRVVIVSRDAQVRHVLAQADDFHVPFGPEMTALAGGTNSVLGMEGSGHQRVREILRQALHREDVADIRTWSRGFADALVDGSAGTIDVMTDLFTRVATETCARYFGLTIHDPNAFAHWTMAVSAQLFADPFGDPKTRALAMNGAARIRPVIADAIARVRANHARFGPKEHPTLVIDRLVQAGMTDQEIVANIMGLATGFIPTNTLAAGNMLEELLSDRALFQQAVDAARVTGDPEHKALRNILLIAARRNPALSPGQWRIVARDADIPVGRGTRSIRRSTDDRKPVVVLAGIMSALRDGRSEANQSSDPEAAADLLFGWQPHSCLGRHVAMEQIVQTFAALLSQPELRAASGKRGWMQRMGPFPVRLDMSFHSMASTQTMVIVSAPVTDGASLESIRGKINDLGNPVSPEIAKTLTATGIVHFASLNVIENGRTEDPAPIVLLELNVDGPSRDALARIAAHCFEWLAPVMQHCAGANERLETAEQLAALLGRHALDLHCKPWGPIGIHYNGTPEFSVADIARQEKLAAFARGGVDHYFQQYVGGRGRAMQALTHVRRFIKQDPFYLLKRRGGWSTLAQTGADFTFSLVRPSRKRLAIADWKAPGSVWAPIGRVAAAPDGQAILAGLGAIALLLALGIGFTLDISWFPTEGGLAGFARWSGLVLLSATGGILFTLLLALAVGTALTLILAAKERRDSVDERHPDYAHVEKLEARENAPQYEQNHIIAVMPLKPGPFRKLVFAFALWGIKQSILYWFRPGFVVTMGTIHYAKWFRVPGTEQFVFLSNYDGNWESYLEDFITRAHWGQSAAWSNGVGFPRTRLLIFDGAKDGDRFKHWVRRQQQETLCWYSRFPHLTTKQIRNNALIEEGLAHASNDTDARRWLACFGSAQREEHEIETSEVQSIVFSGFGHLKHATCLLLRLPAEPEMQKLWLELLGGKVFEHSDKSTFGAGLLPFLERDGPFLNKKGRAHRELRIAFGENPPSDGAAVLALTARGLRALGMGQRDGKDGLSRFPTAFNAAMVGRGRILGDVGANSAESFGWSDDYNADGAVDAALIVYGHMASAANPGTHDYLAKLHTDLIRLLGGDVLHTVPTQPLIDASGNSRLDMEHFGFRDGISQPVIRATQRAALGVPSRDLCEAGEFILGYRNNQGFYPPILSVGEENDYAHDLPVLNAAAVGRFPRFGASLPAKSGRDFGRNGTFLVIRQLDQDVDGFKAALERHASSVKQRYDEIEAALGHKVDADWIAAKMIGRWWDGRPLVGNPPAPNALTAAERSGPAPNSKGVPFLSGTPAEVALDNDFSYGGDDPRGYHCPLGAHIRRANPRDSLEPWDPNEQFITNRHRLLRRGRSYCHATPEKGETKGLLFMALCADLERQFEFVQHSWLNASTFHGLTNEADPIAGANTQGAGAKERTFTIPTPVGPITLENVHSYISARGGGYFFVPSQAALKYLSTQAKQAAARASAAAANGEDHVLSDTVTDDGASDQAVIADQ